MSTFFCPLCKNNFTKANFQRHYKRIHKYEKAFPCKKCGDVFSSKKALCNHYKTVENLIIFECEVCNYPFLDKENLGTHKNHTHGISSKKTQVLTSNSKGKSSKVEMISSNRSIKRKRVLSEQQTNCLIQDDDILRLDNFDSAGRLNSEIEDLKLENEKLLKANEESSMKIKEMEEKLQIGKREIENYKKCIQISNAEIDNLRSAISDEKVKNQSLEKEIATLKMAIKVQVISENIKNQESISNNENATAALINFGKQNEIINPIKQSEVPKDEEMSDFLDEDENGENLKIDTSLKSTLPDPEDKANDSDKVYWKTKYESLNEQFNPLKTEVETMKIQIQELQKLQIGLNKTHSQSFKTMREDFSFEHENKEVKIEIKEELTEYEYKV